jgi:uncharacterized protein involved in exopolysaccharide biosynthesis
MTNEQQKLDDVQEINLIDYIYIMFKWRKFVFYAVLGTFVLMMIVMYLIVPRYYKATTVILPPKQKSQFSAASALKNMLPMGGFGLAKASDDLLLYRTIVSSRSCEEEIINTYDLIRRYDVDDIEYAIKELEGNFSAVIDEDDVSLTITVYDKDSVIATSMANKFVEILNRISLSLTTREAKSNRVFIERRYRQNKDDMLAAEDSLRSLQERYSVYLVPDQFKAAIEAASRVKAEAILKEIEVGILSRTVSETDSRLIQARLELSEYNKKLQQMKFGNGTIAYTGDLFPPFQRMPELGLLYFRYYRETQVQQQLFELLTPLYEQAKIEENRDTPSLLVLDKAVVPPKPAKPRRGLTAVIVTGIMLLLSLIFTFVLERIETMRKATNVVVDEKLAYIKSQFHWKRFFYIDKSPS